MPTTARSHPARQALVWFLAALLLVAAMPPSDTWAAEGTDLVAVSETLFHQRHLQVREDPTGNGVHDHPAAPAISGQTDLLDSARAWAAQMAKDDRLKHNPVLADEVCCWSKVGENVAFYKGPLHTEEQVRAATERLIQAWISSDGHRRNMMDSAWDQFAVGIHLSNDAIWATTVFRRLDGTSTPPGTSYGDEGPHGDAGRTSTAATNTGPTATARDVSATCSEVDHDGYADTHGNAHDASIKCASGHGLASGRSADTYAPGGAVNRAQVLAFVRRAIERSGTVLETETPDYFTDDNGSVHEQSANMLAHAGLVVVGDGTLRPGDAASRAFIASVAGRALEQFGGVQPSGDYFDDDNGHADEHFINVLAEAGVTTGAGNRSYGPESGLTRAQMATVLVRTFDALRA